MKIAVVSEISSVHRNRDIIEALAGREHDILNVGMKDDDCGTELTYIHTGLLTGLLLNSSSVDFVIGGCGTGQGYLNSAMQYPGVACGLICSPLDAWLFPQINGGNCVSLQLNKEYGWAADINLGFIFDRLLSVEIGCGYPEHRKDSQRSSREDLAEISERVHHPMDEIVSRIPMHILQPVIEFPGVMNLLDGNVKTALDKQTNGAN